MNRKHIAQMLTIYLNALAKPAGGVREENRREPPGASSAPM